MGNLFYLRQILINIPRKNHILKYKINKKQGQNQKDLPKQQLGRFYMAKNKSL
jgi:hypothetical protein